MEQIQRIKSVTVQDQEPWRISFSSIKQKSKINDSHYSFLEFFSGSGLVTQGLKSYFRTVWANDICSKKAAVYIANHGSKYFHLGSIANIKGENLPNAMLAWASFPCQDLSLAGLTEGIHAPRSGLVWQWLRIIDEMALKPPILVAENVSGLVSVAGGEHYKALHRALIKRGYHVGAMLIDASHWIPQSRPRVFVVATNTNLSIPPEVITPRPTWLHTKSICKAASGLEGWVWWNMPEPTARKKYFSDIIEWDAPFAEQESETRNISLISERQRNILDQISESEQFVAPGYKRTRNGKQVLELRFDNLSGCLRTPEGGSSRQIIVIKKNGGLRSRLLTVREAARLMGAPETYKIPGSYNDGYRAMGDAVAVPVVKWLAKHLLLPILKINEQ
jgi:DNA (cytosine-5)-methyltransferase 1